jgi:hypothetical protein
MPSLTKRETVVKKRVAKMKALKKGKKLNTARPYSSKYEKIQKANTELLKKLKS